MQASMVNFYKPKCTIMKILATIVIALVLTLPASMLAQSKDIRADIDKDIPLAEAVRQANEQFPSAQPLTEQEVIAAVRAIKLEHPDISEPIYQIYQRVVKENLLPRGVYFSHISEWHTPYGHFQVDWKDLTLTSLPVGSKDDKIGYGYNYRIRATFVSSQPLTETEAKAYKK